MFQIVKYDRCNSCLAILISKVYIKSSKKVSNVGIKKSDLIKVYSN